MKTIQKTLAAIIIILGALLNQAAAQDADIFPKGEIGKNTNNYTGKIWLNELSKPDNIFKFSIAQAVYAPGSKLDWHIHPGGQILLITSGTGYYQEKGKRRALACRSAKQYVHLCCGFSFRQRKNDLEKQGN